MNFKRGVRNEELEINFIPLIDVLLVIIIFLMVSATFSRTSELQINLPTADANAPQEKPLTITVEVDANGRYLVNGKEANGAVVSDLAAVLTQVGSHRASLCQWNFSPRWKPWSLHSTTMVLSA